MIFLNSASSVAALVFYLPGVCTQTDTEGKQRKAKVRNSLKYSEKTQHLMNTLYVSPCPGMSVISLMIAFCSFERIRQRPVTDICDRQVVTVADVP